MPDTLYRHRFVSQTLILGVAGMSLAVPLLGYEFWPFPTLMMVTLVLYLIGKRKTQPA
jgi:hypothetical protein